MNTNGSFEIFRKVPGGRPVCLDTSSTLDCALNLAQEAASAQPGDYFIFDRQNQKFIDASPEPASRPHTRVLVADDHESVRKGVRQVLLGHGRVEIVGEASNGREAIEETRKLQPDLIIMDWSMPELDGLTAAQMIKKFSPKTAIVIFSVHTSDLFTNLAKSLGLEGFVTKGSSSQALLCAVDAVLHDQTYFPS
ncbi:MAG TPA: response regulator transcription factor [Candidatus Acidoferrales bacterium]|jgi:CheY-like chemotaxis protein|nr:response regulator transcription factor [Candidatus Acidoferrales bacterium]